MTQVAQPKILAVMNDLFFSVKINDGAKRLGMTAEFVKDKTIALEKIRARPPLIIFDLNWAGAEPLELIRAAAGIPTIGFVSHVQTDLRQQAVEAGCGLVVARSAFAQNLNEMLEAALGAGSGGNVA
ncbi:MAG TPA: response regulator [Bryobacteraceae bacterium]|jgi:CheY-like chemotaxis protein|nr:response regulator [Bryobacteraceae bacterium]